jgi:hypothetical protein
MPALPNVETFARLTRLIFSHMHEHALKGELKLVGEALSLSLRDKNDQLHTINGHLTFSHGHWTLGPDNAILRIENLPVELASGAGTVDFAIFLMPLQENPTINENVVEVNGVSRFKGLQIEQFIGEFRSRFVNGWNQQS